ncbi:uncharacterized protein LOC142168883 [Nicotiana tabacum]|uniref:Uncharacterized protein LOC142168883 n=1 Tax=Nicotiana tabacum TaxID=4097 RepID=A0AC58SMF9_TOBAC
MSYEAEYWPVKNSHVQKIKVTEMRMLRWMCVHTRRDKIRNKDIRDKVGVVSVVDKMREVRLKWFWQVKRRSTNIPMRRCERLPVIDLRRGRGIPSKNWRKVIRQNMTDLQLTKDNNPKYESIDVED